MATTTTTQYYKVLGPDREAIHGGSGIWPEQGEWTEPRAVSIAREDNDLGHRLRRTQDERQRLTCLAVDIEAATR